MDAVETRFVQLLAEKQARDNTMYTISDVERLSGVERRRLYAWRDGDITAVKMDEIKQLCDWFECKAGDLIHYVPLVEGQETVAMAIA